MISVIFQKIVYIFIVYDKFKIYFYSVHFVKCMIRVKFIYIVCILPILPYYIVRIFPSV